MMALLRTIKTFIKDPDPTGAFEEVTEGLNLVEGIARTNDPLRSPVRGQQCVAFFYRSFLVMTGGRAPAIHKLKEAEVYAPFELEMDQGTLQVEPAKPGKFTKEQHQELSRQYGKEFKGIEELVLPGDRVRVRGKVKRVKDGLLLKMSDVTVIEKQVVQTGVVGKKKKRKKGK
jgi:hypothetical protein